ncbi:MAG: nucleotidyltransferase domain-containing protein [Pseudomonadota bacterium]
MLQLREKDRQALKAALARFPEVRQAWVFGSRATGTARRASDIDLAIEAPDLNPARWHALQEALEQAPVIYQLDVVRLDTLLDPKLRHAIHSEGVAV